MPTPSAVALEIDELKRQLDVHRVVATSLGVFSLREYAGYDGRNPMTGATVPIPSRTIPHLRIDEEFAIAALGKRPQPRPPEEPYESVIRVIDPTTGATVFTERTFEPAVAESEGGGVVEIPAVTIPCETLRAHVLATLGPKRTAKYSGFGNFVRTVRPARVDFLPSQVWKAEVNGRGSGVPQ